MVIREPQEPIARYSPITIPAWRYGATADPRFLPELREAGIFGRCIVCTAMASA
jgi:hypothetical protein